ncbi:MAG: gliding motility-associated C-terminal domain-containing protein [Bacteroidota bacterium]
MLAKCIIPQVVLLTLCFSQSHAQYLSDKGFFEIAVSEGCPAGGCNGNIVSGCAPLTISILMTPTSPVDCYSPMFDCDIDFENDGVNDSGTDVTTVSHTYNTPGQFTLFMVFAATGTDQITINVEPSDPPDFSIFSCDNRSLQVNIEDDQYENYIINFGDGSPEVIRPRGSAPAEHTYANTNQRTVSVRGVNENGVDNCSSQQDIVVPFENNFPVSRFDSLISLNDNNLALYYDLAPDIQHRLEIKSGNGSFTFFGSLDAELEADTFQLADIANTSYCFRIVSIDPCAGPNATAAISEIICNTLLEVDFLDEVNSLSWQVEGNINSFDYTRVNVTDGEVFIRRGLNGLSFNDTDIDCEREYCYTLTSIYTDNSISRSLEVCGNSFSTTPPTTINDLSVSVGGANIAIEWPVMPGEVINTYTISRGNTASTLLDIGSTETNTFENNGLDTSERSFCYQISSENECGNVNRNGRIACSILLTGFIAPDNTVSLTWNDYNGWSQGISEYTIEKEYFNNDAPDGNSTIPEFQEVDNNASEQVINYRIRAIPRDNTLAPVQSNSIMLIKPNNIYFPNAFTPNGDGNNDTFSVKGRFIVNYDLRIFNRWGEEVFNTTDPDVSWDGTREGKSLPLGAYAFKVDIKDQAGQEITEAGTVLLLRN